MLDHDETPDTEDGEGADETPDTGETKGKARKSYTKRKLNRLIPEALHGLLDRAAETTGIEADVLLENTIKMLLADAGPQFKAALLEQSRLAHATRLKQVEEDLAGLATDPQGE